MAVIIRLKRFGKRSKPAYRVVALEESQKRQGREIEVLGNYDPTVNPPKVSLENKRIEYWLSVGAKTSDTVRDLIRKNKK